MKVFIGYRRDDSSETAQRVRDALSQEYGSASVFMDVDSIPIGADFRGRITRSLGDADVAVFVIGSRWLEAKTGAGERRLDMPDDFVRIEVETALHQRVPLVPLLVDGTSVPSAAALPSTIRDLAYYNAHSVNAASFQHDVRTLITRLNGLARGIPPELIRFDTGENYEAPEALIWDLAYNPDGHHLLAASRRYIRMWDLSSRKKVLEVEVPGWLGRLSPTFSLDFTTLAISPDGSRFAAGADDQKVRVWDAKDGKEVTTLSHWWHLTDSLTKSKKYHMAVAFHPDGRQLAAGSHNIIHVCDIDTGSILTTINCGRQWRGGNSRDATERISVAYSPDGSQIATSTGMDEKLSLWDSVSGKLVREWPKFGFAKVVFSPEGKYLAATSPPRLGYTDQGLIPFLVSAKRPNHSLALNTILVLDLSSGEITSTIGQGQVSGRCLAISRDGQYVTTGERVWDFTNGRLLPGVDPGEVSITCCAFNPLGTQLAVSGGYERLIRLVPLFS